MTTNPITEKQTSLALSAVKSLGLVISIVDMVRSEETGEFFVLEVNDSMGIFVEHCLRPGYRLGDKYLEPDCCYDELKMDLLALCLYESSRKKQLNNKT